MVRIVLLRLLESYFRHRWLYVLPLIIGLISGGVYAAILPPEYTASGRLYVAQENLLANLTASNTSDSWLTASESTVAEIDELMTTQAFVRSVIQKTDLEQNMSAGSDAVVETLAYVRATLLMEVVGDNLVQISATGDDPNVLYQLVISTMNTYVQWKINNDYQESAAASSFFDNLMLPYQDELDQARSDLVTFLTTHPEPVRGTRPPAEQMELERLQAAAQRAETRLAAARDSGESARLAQVQSESVTKQTYMVIDQPEIPQVAEVSTTVIITNLVIFLVVGIFLSLVGIVGGALLDRTLRFPVDVRYGLSLPVLAMIPVSQVISPQAAMADQPTTSAPVAAAAKEKDISNSSEAGDVSTLQPQL